MLRRLRGIAVTALTWALPWAVIGGTFTLAAYGLRRGTFFGEYGMTPHMAWTLFAVGAKLSAIGGAIAGGLFAAILALSGRRLTFGQLSASRMVALGAIGGAGVAMIPVLLVGPGGAASLLPLLPFVGICGALGSGSAWTMLVLARRGTDSALPTPPSADVRSIAS